MTLTSMTGFARAAGASGGVNWAWEIKTVNGRTLDVRVRGPQGFDAVDTAARAAIAARLGRGTCYANLTANRSGNAAAVRVNAEALEAVLASFELIRGRVEAGPPTLDGILALKGVMDIAEPEEDEAARAAMHAALLAGLEEALDALVASRRAEGAALGAVLAGHLDAMSALVAQAEAAPGRTAEAIRARLGEQVRALLDSNASLDPDRLHQEAVLLAGKADIREELDRLVAHIATARELVAGGGVVGRKLDFLSQELGREANTLCSKSNDIALTRIGLDLKIAVEQFREQVQNIE